MNAKLKRISKKLVKVGICLEELKKTMKSIAQDRWSSGRDSKPGLPYYGLLRKCNGTVSAE